MVATNIIQTWKLIKAGMNPDTADTTCEADNMVAGRVSYPSWSLGALWEEVAKVGRFAFDESDKPDEILEKLITLYEEHSNRSK